jgi:ribosomal protein L40E
MRHQSGTAGKKKLIMRRELGAMAENGRSCGMDPKVCPKCGERNNPDFDECWKCHQSFLPWNQQLLLGARRALGKMAAVGQRGLKLCGVLLLVGCGFFCWGLVTNVILGEMTTGQYIHKIVTNIPRISADLPQKAINNWTGPILETLERVTKVEGVLNGPSRKYYRNGRLKSEVDYKDGKREGAARLYYESGQLKAEGTYQNGQLTGPVREYDEKGNLKN